MTTPELTLNKVKEQIRPKNRVVQVSDFLTDKERNRIKLHREAQKAKKQRGFDEIDAYSAEILGRFGYQAWKAWLSGEINARKMSKMVQAERAREKARLLGLESIIISAVAGANHPAKGKKVPKTLKNAINILKNEQRLAQGLRNG